jgi:hypothetical protein
MKRASSRACWEPRVFARVLGEGGTPHGQPSDLEHRRSGARDPSRSRAARSIALRRAPPRFTQNHCVSRFAAALADCDGLCISRYHRPRRRREG